MLYKFEKYYLSLAIYKVVHIIKKFLSYRLGRYFAIAIWFFTSIMITGFIIAYFFIGVNVFLEKIHLEKYRIEEINFMNSKLDLKPFFKK